MARPGRDPDTVKRVMLRMSDDIVDKLDELCKVNKRSRREIAEFLILEAYGYWEKNPDDRITPP